MIEAVSKLNARGPEGGAASAVRSEMTYKVVQWAGITWTFQGFMVVAAERLA